MSNTDSGYRTMADDSCVERTEKYRVQISDGRLFLHLANDENGAMTVMELAQPNDLPALYTRKMLLPLAFIPSATDVLLIGLGGGQQAKFIHRYLPELRTIGRSITGCQGRTIASTRHCSWRRRFRKRPHRKSVG